MCTWRQTSGAHHESVECGSTSPCWGEPLPPVSLTFMASATGVLLGISCFCYISYQFWILVMWAVLYFECDWGNWEAFACSWLSAYWISFALHCLKTLSLLALNFADVSVCCELPQAFLAKAYMSTFFTFKNLHAFEQKECFAALIFLKSLLLVLLATSIFFVSDESFLLFCCIVWLITSMLDTTE